MNTGLKIEITAKGDSAKPGGFLEVKADFNAGGHVTSRCFVKLDFDAKTAHIDRQSAIEADYSELIDTLRQVCANLERVALYGSKSSNKGILS